MDLITGTYLCGQWPRDPPRTCVTDKSTQTPGFWTDDQRGLKKHRRSLSWSSADHQREISRLCLQVRQSVLGLRQNKQREKNVVSSFSCVQAEPHPAPVGSMVLSKPAMCSMSSCSDCIHRELENVFVTGVWEEWRDRGLQDGRCAPVPPPHHHHHHQSGDLSTLCTDGQICFHSNRSLHSFSFVSDLQHTRMGRGSANERSSPLPLLVSSPEPKGSFVLKRVRPDGSEKLFEENVSSGSAIFSCPDRSRVSFVPTGAGPFCPVRTPTSLAAPLQPEAHLPGPSHCRDV